MRFIFRNRTLNIIFGVTSIPLVVLFIGFLIFVSCVNSGNPKVTSADGIVVLTGGPERIGQAIKLLAQGKGQRLLISGVHPSTSRKALSKLFPHYKAMFKCCIDIDHLARNTIGNASQTRDWVHSRSFRSIIVVTAKYHMPRSMLELRSVMPDVTLIPFAVTVKNVHVESWWAYPGTLWLLTKEYFKTYPALIRLGLSRISQ